ncbi:MAG: hypothetical protein CM1200mP2_26120 [Planctomycetaceae bacterium]|nr:MAG: hypothetical protein CM1200mP2_26120 [Planctomycetaceae bacterium]
MVRNTASCTPTTRQNLERATTGHRIREQTACLVRLPDNTILLVFGHKTDGSGQRFMASFDEGAVGAGPSTNGSELPVRQHGPVDRQPLVSVSHRIIDGVGIFHARQWSAPKKTAFSEAVSGLPGRPNPGCRQVTLSLPAVD